VSEETKTGWANPEPSIHHAIVLWAANCAERAVPMTACRTAAFAAHAAARDATEAGSVAAVAAARAAGQACAVAHMFDHSPHAASYAAKAVGLYGDGKTDRETEPAWQWEKLAPELRPIVFPKRL
jgi:NAD/NADP transhydrogenase alpha subunit